LSTLQLNVDPGMLALKAKSGRRLRERCPGWRVIFVIGATAARGGPPVCTRVALPETFGVTEVSTAVMVTDPAVVEAVIVAL
jgi:hypothetical protein